MVEPSDFVVTLLRDAASSHLLETVITRCSDHVFAVLWTSYFSSNLPKLAIHPVANFVVSRAVGRVSPIQLREAFEQLASSWDKLLRRCFALICRLAHNLFRVDAYSSSESIGRTSLETSILRRCCPRGQSRDGAGSVSTQAIPQAVFSAFQLTSAEKRMQIVPCVLHLTTYDV